MMRTAIFCAAVISMIAFVRCTSTARAAAALTTPYIVGIEQCTASVRPPNDCVYVTLPLSDAGERRIRELIHSARQRELREAREAERQERISGGVWGFVSYSYRISFADGTADGDQAWLHLSGGAAWLEGIRGVGRVVFTPEESVALAESLPRQP